MLHSKYRRLFVSTLLLLSFFAFGFAGDKANAKWAKFSEQLVKAVKSPNSGVRASAIQHMIRYYDSLDVYAARYDLMDLFLKSDNPGMRRLSLVAMHKINSRFDMGYLQLHYPYEKDNSIKSQIAAVLHDTGRYVPRH